MNKVIRSTIDLSVLNQIKWQNREFDDTELEKAKAKYE